MTFQPQLGTESLVPALALLFCEAAPEIGVIPAACSEKSRPRLHEWLGEMCQAGRMWVIVEGENPLGMLILDEDPTGLWYAITSKEHQKKGIGTALIAHMQARQDVLWAEARTVGSRKMLSSCGFTHGGEMSAPKIPGSPPQPIYRWSRSAK